MGKELTRRQFLGGVVGMMGEPLLKRLEPWTEKETFLPIPRKKQNYPLSCEAACGGMAAEYFLGEDKILQGHLNYETYLLSKMGSHQNPNKGFRGDYNANPDYDCQNYGAYCSPLASALESLNLFAAPKYNLSYKELAREIMAGHPAVVWMSFSDAPIRYKIDDDGDEFSLIFGEHTVAVTGYMKLNGRFGFIYNDPLDDSKNFWTKKFPRWRDDSRGDFGGMAVVVYGQKSKSIPDYNFSQRKLSPEFFSGTTVIRKGPSVNQAAITIDDGWNLNYLTEILDFSENFKTPLTLFIIGKIMADKKWEEQLKRALDLGCELQNHTWSHPNLIKLLANEGEDEVKKELEKSQEAIGRLSPKGNSGRFFRPPGGGYNSDIVKIAENLGLQTVIWSLSSGGTGRNSDGKLISPEQIRPTLEKAGRGEIILFHTNWNDAQVLPGFYGQTLKRKNLKPVLLSELVG